MEAQGIYMCGIESEYHRKGIGSMIFEEVEEYLKNLGYIYLLVKPLSDIVDYVICPPDSSNPDCEIRP
jgi:ribosomal protein S18 acetylase RimI-like enzyme